MSFVNGHDVRTRELLDRVASGEVSSQRGLARELGIALGLTNLLLRRTISRGWVRVVRLTATRVRYYLTPAGVAEKARVSRLYLQESVRFYITARDRIRESLATLGPPSTRIVFYGAGEVAEIAYVCLQETDLTLVGVVGEHPRRHFFGLRVHRDEDLRDGLLGDTPYDCLVITSFDNRTTTEATLTARGIRPERVHSL